jgi:hypothetical protein
MRLLVAVVSALVIVGGASAGSRVSICDVQEYDDQGLSPLVGQWVTVSGTVTCPPGYFYPFNTCFYIESGGCGVRVFCYEPQILAIALGDNVEVSGNVVEYISSSTGAGATTEIYIGYENVVVLSSGHPAPIPTEVTCAEVNSEENEGRLLRTSGRVVDLALPYSFYISDGTVEVEVYRGVPDSTSFAGVSYGDSICVTGLLGQYDRTPPFLDSYELMPRTSRDVEWCDATALEEVSWGSIKALYR